MCKNQSTRTAKSKPTGSGKSPKNKQRKGLVPCTTVKATSPSPRQLLLPASILLFSLFLTLGSWWIHHNAHWGKSEAKKATFKEVTQAFPSSRAEGFGRLIFWIEGTACLDSMCATWRYVVEVRCRVGEKTREGIFNASRWMEAEESRFRGRAKLISANGYLWNVGSLDHMN